MAKQTKKSETEKPAAKKAKSVKKNDLIEKIENNLEEKENTTDVVDATEVGVDFDKIEEAIKSVDTSINDEEIEKEINDSLEKAIADVKEIDDEIKTFKDSQEKFNTELQNNPENAKELIEKELEKTNKLKKELEQKISSIKPRSTSVTTWWNGMGYDF